VTVTFTVDQQLATTLSIPGGYENAGWVYTFVPDYNFGNAGFVLGKMDNDTSVDFDPPECLILLTSFQCNSAAVDGAMSRFHLKQTALRRTCARATGENPFQNG
jgi:hypothetical protein